MANAAPESLTALASALRVAVLGHPTRLILEDPLGLADYRTGG
jgi:hypothetical protein